jgi:glycosyltransferase involved in cell wall biosynthesis
MHKRTVCFIARLDFLDKPGGDTTQWHMYEQTAREAGFSTLTWFKDEPIPDADVYHAFNIDRPLELYPKLRRVKQRGRPFVLSTIHHPHAWMNRFRAVRQQSGSTVKAIYHSICGGSVERMEAVRELVVLAKQQRLSHILDLWPRWISRVRWLLDNADKIMLASRREADFLRQDLGHQYDSDKMAIVPNWVEGIPRDATQMPAVVCAMPELPVIVVGRLEARKNMLRISRLANEALRPLIFIGRPNPSERAYEAELQGRLSSLVQWVPGVSREQMAGFYMHSSFLLNASYVEVSPLVDIEALMFGCPVATTRYALHHEFLPKDTPICDAYDDQSILRLLEWRPPRLSPFCAVDAAECKSRLAAIYTRLLGKNGLKEQGT